MTTTNVAVWRYTLPSVNHEGWATFLLDSQGMLAVASDFGDYVYHWPPGGWGDYDFRRFLLMCDDHYLTTKLSSGETVLDSKRTRSGILEYLDEGLAEGWLSAEQVEQERKLVACSEFDNEVGFYAWYMETELSDASDRAVYVTPPRLVAFMQQVWPRFRELLRQDLDENQRIADLVASQGGSSGP